jgi:hypothetical protein
MGEDGDEGCAAAQEVSREMSAAQQKKYPGPGRLKKSRERDEIEG